MQQLRVKLAVAERTAKAEGQMKVYHLFYLAPNSWFLFKSPFSERKLISQEKYQLRFKVLEERIKASNGNSKIIASDGRNIASGPSRRQSFGGAESLSASSFSSSNGYLSRKNSSSKSGSLRSNTASVLLKHTKLSSRSFDGGSRSLERERKTSVANVNVLDNTPTNTNDQTITTETFSTHGESANGTPIEKSKTEHEDYVSGMLYDMLQKEVISLRKACQEKDQTLKDKDDAIEVWYLIF